MDGRLLQDELVSKGLAKVDYLYGDYKYTVKIQATEEAAKAKKVGIWGISDNDTTIKKTTSTKNSSKKNNSKKTEKNSFIDRLIDDLLGKVIDYINSLLDNIATFIESMI